MAGLSYGTAARIATRELHSSRGRFTFVIFSVAIGVAALTGRAGIFVGVSGDAVAEGAEHYGGGHCGADVSAADAGGGRRGLTRCGRTGNDESPVTEMLSMASAATSMDPLLVSLKAVEPGKYPFYGSVVLAPAMPLSAALTDTTVAVGDDLLLRLHLKVGDSIKLGTEAFRIASVVEDEPDRLSGRLRRGRGC